MRSGVIPIAAARWPTVRSAASARTTASSTRPTSSSRSTIPSSVPDGNVQRRLTRLPTLPGTPESLRDMLEVASLTKSYPTARGPLTVLSDVSFSLAPGDAAAVMGPSGSGKSSLLYILGALEPPTSGTISLDGRNPFQLAANDLAAFRNASIGFVFQDHCLLPQCTVLENVLIPTLVGPDGGDAAGHARTLIDQVGLGDRVDHRPAELSGGERQRV